MRLRPADVAADSIAAPGLAGAGLATSVEPRMVIVSHGGETVAMSTCVLRLDQPPGAPALFLPRADVRMALLEPSGRVDDCPVRGKVRYWTLTIGGRRVEDAAVSLDEPSAVCSRMGDHIAFDPEKVDEVETVAASA